MRDGQGIITSSERALWSNVLLIAVLDALIGPEGEPNPTLRARKTNKARNYITTPSSDLFFVCTCAGIEMNAVIERMQRHLAKAPTSEELAEARKAHRNSLLKRGGDKQRGGSAVAAYEEQGALVEIADLLETGPVDLSGVDIVHFTGSYPFRLLRACQETGLAQALVRRATEGEFAVVGASPGTILLAAISAMRPFSPIRMAWRTRRASALLHGLEKIGPYRRGRPLQPWRGGQRIPSQGDLMMAGPSGSFFPSTRPRGRFLSDNNMVQVSNQQGRDKPVRSPHQTTFNLENGGYAVTSWIFYIHINRLDRN